MKKINGKPMSHWEAMGKRLVVDAMVRAAINWGWSGDPTRQSIPQQIAANRLMELANAEDPVLVDELLAERARCQEGLAQFMASLSKGKGK